MGASGESRVSSVYLGEVGSYVYVCYVRVRVITPVSGPVSWGAYRYYRTGRPLRIPGRGPDRAAGGSGMVRQFPIYRIV